MEQSLTAGIRGWLSPSERVDLVIEECRARIGGDFQRWKGTTGSKQFAVARARLWAEIVGLAGAWGATLILSLEIWLLGGNSLGAQWTVGHIGIVVLTPAVTILMVPFIRRRWRDWRGEDVSDEDYAQSLYNEFLTYRSLWGGGGLTVVLAISIIGMDGNISLAWEYIPLGLSALIFGIWTTE